MLSEEYRRLEEERRDQLHALKMEARAQHSPKRKSLKQIQQGVETAANVVTVLIVIAMFVVWLLG